MMVGQLVSKSVFNKKEKCMKELSLNEVQDITGGVVDGGCVIEPSLPWTKPKILMK